jgi:hypothetical protein
LLILTRKFLVFTRGLLVFTTPWTYAHDSMQS